MKRFIIMANVDKTLYFIHFTYKNAGCSKRTKRCSTYHSLEDAKKAAKRFLERGYKLTDSMENL
jgi:hypothetical protein